MSRVEMVLLAFILIFPTVTVGANIWNQLVSFKGKLEASDYVQISSLRLSLKGSLKIVNLPFNNIL